MKVDGHDYRENGVCFYCGKTRDEVSVDKFLENLAGEMTDVIERAKETTQAEADLATLKRENDALKERHARTAEQLQGVRSTMQVTIDALRERLTATEHERYQLQVNLRAVQENPSATEEALHDQVEKVRAYVKGLRIWGTEDKAQICTDILYIIGEN